MRQYTTPLQTLFIPDHNLSGCDVYVSYSDNRRKKVLTVNEVTLEQLENGTRIKVHLTQEQTAMFKEQQSVDVQVNWVTRDGNRYATEIVPVLCKENLLKEVIT